MNLKKLTSILLVISISITLLSFSVSAAGEGLTITYENASNQAIADGSQLVKDNVFYAVVKLTNSTTLFAADIKFTYNANVVEPVKIDGVTAASVFNDATTSKVHLTLPKIFDNTSESDLSPIKAQESIFTPATSSFSYTVISQLINDELNDYALTSTQQTSGLVLIKFRFKVKATGDASFNFTSENSLRASKLGSSVFITDGESPLVIPAAGYSVTYYANGGTPAPAPLSAVTSIPALPTPTLAGSTLEGWYTTAGFTAGTKVTAPVTISANTSLYAKWTLNTYSVTYVTDGSAVDTLTGVTALPAELPTTSKDRYTFDGWFYANDTEAQANDVISQNTTLTAKWTVIPVTELPVVTGEVTKAASETVTFINKDKQEVTEAHPVITIPCKVPASITADDITNKVEFGISLGGVKFPAKTNENTLTTLNNNGGKYIIKFVDSLGKLAGKTFQAFNYFGAAQSVTVPVTIPAN